MLAAVLSASAPVLAGAPLIVIAGGGTGGHVFPGLAVAERLESAGARVAWLVAGGMERGILEARAARFFVAPFAPPRKTGAVYAWRLARAVCSAVRILRRERPGAVLAMGGYASLPGGLAAALLRLPLLTHEQNSAPGRAVNLLRRFAAKALGGFPDSPPGSETVGVPVASAFNQFPPPSQRYAGRRGPLRLLTLGGSQGARDLNLATPKALAQIPEVAVFVVHQCGRGNLEETRAAYRAAGLATAKADGEEADGEEADGECRVRIVEFTDEAPRLMAEADVVLCRAGASTLAEAAAVGVAALLAPYPFAAANHQEKNADFFAENGGAEKLPPEPERAAARVAAFLAEETRASLRERAARVHALARPRAAARAAAACLRAAEAA